MMHAETMPCDATIFLFILQKRCTRVQPIYRASAAGYDFAHLNLWKNYGLQQKDSLPHELFCTRDMQTIQRECSRRRLKIKQHCRFEWSCIALVPFFRYSRAVSADAKPFSFSAATTFGFAFTLSSKHGFNNGSCKAFMCASVHSSSRDRLLSFLGHSGTARRFNTLCFLSCTQHMISIVNLASWAGMCSMKWCFGTNNV